MELARGKAEHLKRKNVTLRTQREDAEGTETTCRKLRACSLVEVCDFFVEVGESGFKRFSMVGVGGGGEVVGDSGAR